MIVIDGGKGQLSSASQAIETIYNAFLQVKTPKASHVSIQDIVPICSLAKREEEVFIPGNKDPIILKKGSPELMVLQKIRDESHRFAITFNRQSREKSYTRNILEEIPGIGPKTRSALLKKFGSVQKMILADISDISPLVSSSQMKKLQEYGLVGQKSNEKT